MPVHRKVSCDILCLIISGQNSGILTMLVGTELWKGYDDEQLLFLIVDCDKAIG